MHRPRFYKWRDELQPQKLPTRARRKYTSQLILTPGRFPSYTARRATIRVQRGIL